MSTKAKFFSVLVLILLVTPVVFNRRPSGEVLGTNEGSSNGILSGFSQDNASNKVVPAQSTIVNNSGEGGEIASGVITRPDADIAADPIILEGKIIVNTNTPLIASSDKFPLGTSLKVTNGDKTVDVVVQGKTVLSTDTLLVVNKQTFEALGGSVESGSISVKISREL